MSSITDIDADSLDSVVEKSGIPVVLEFWVRSCGFCQKFKPVYEQLPDIFGDRIKFAKMNMMKRIDDLRLAEGMGVEQTPTTKVFCKGREVGEIVGYRQLEEVVDLLRNILASNKDCSQ